MEKKEIKYEDWPVGSKIITALSSKTLTPKGYNIAYVIGIVYLIGTVIQFILDVVNNGFSLTGFNFMYIANLSIGLACLAEGITKKWIAENSSWQERFDNQSSTAHKVIYIVLTLYLLFCALGVVFHIW